MHSVCKKLSLYVKTQDMSTESGPTVIAAGCLQATNAQPAVSDHCMASKGVFDYQIRIHSEFESRLNPTHTRHA